MKKISSGSTFILKRILPVFFFLLPLIMITLMLTTATSKPIPVPALFIPCMIAVVGFFVFRQLVMDLADEVFDGGDFLLVRNRGQEERVPFTNIMNVSITQHVNPPRITLRLVKPGRFGDEIAFTPLRETTFLPRKRHRLADELMVRVDRARVNRPR